ncbi:hypothetical protein ACJMK2_031476 [Sinanodonta woodiana]|uniref:Uncharacterized protein n=1 Tax=Sinanodonta woodiana TaxID=1069815 RepID=A0ABD3WYX4_SINWO
MGTFSKQSRALAGMSNVAQQYDHAAGVIRCSSIQDRVFHKFEKTFAPTDGSLPQQDNKAWIQHHTFILDYETGK